jgi:RimJ/RimL family protein N-acetyltransferase
MEQTTHASTEPVLNVVGERVALGPVHRGVLPLWLRWENDFAVTRTDGGKMGVMTQERLEGLFDEGLKNQGQDAIRFLLYERATLRPIGTTNLDGIDRHHRKAEFGICIGEKDCWGKGYGTEATRLTLDYAFTVLGLHSVVLNVASYNEPAIRAYRRAGFREAGRRREALRLGERFHDEVVMDCLAVEFESPLLAALVAGG